MGKEHASGIGRVDWLKVWDVIKMACADYGDDMEAYLCWLGVRLPNCVELYWTSRKRAVILRGRKGPKPVLALGDLKHGDEICSIMEKPSH